MILEYLNKYVLKFWVFKTNFDEYFYCNNLTWDMSVGNYGVFYLPKKRFILHFIIERIEFLGRGGGVFYFSFKN